MQAVVAVGRPPGLALHSGARHEPGITARPDRRITVLAGRLRDRRQDEDALEEQLAQISTGLLPIWSNKSITRSLTAPAAEIAALASSIDKTALTFPTMRAAQANRASRSRALKTINPRTLGVDVCPSS